jgi:predicted transcriptional regulator
MEALSQIFFELSHPRRLQVFHLLEGDGLRLSQVAEKVEVSTSEASRHLARLSRARLIQKTADQVYRPTPFGERILAFLPSLHFLTEQKDYFLTHDLSPLPPSLLLRLGDLQRCQRISGVGQFLKLAEEFFEKAEAFIWIIADQDFPSFHGRILRDYPENFDLRLIVPKGLEETGEFRRLLAHLPAQQRSLKKVKLALGVSEKEGAFLLPNLQGEVDYGLFFRGESPEFLQWLKDLFLWYWSAPSPTP